MSLDSKPKLVSTAKPCTAKVTEILHCAESQLNPVWLWEGNRLVNTVIWLVC